MFKRLKKGALELDANSLDCVMGFSLPSRTIHRLLNIRKNLSSSITISCI